jgi:Dolichyl-phosphate-mannose-protein mannosyltransferase
VILASVSNDGHSPRHRRAAVAAILTVTILRLAYLYFACPYDLAPDEAHYWDWSRHLDWSYYSKGPVVAWIIRAACELFGDASLAAAGTLMPAVRTPAVLFGGGLLAALYVLTWQTYRNDRLALWVVIAALSMPAFTACSLVMTIDAPFLCCWAWALVFGRWGMVDGKWWAWPAAGSLVALGILAKYTMALWLVSAGLFVLATPTHRCLLLRPGLWVMIIVAALSAIPILWWNSHHDWVTFRHVAVQAGVAESKHSTGIRWFGPFEFIGGQCALLLVYWFIVWVAALVRYRPFGATTLGQRYLWWMSVPTFGVFALSSLRASGQINWPVSAYLSGAVLAAGLLSEALSGRFRTIHRIALGMALTLGFATSIVMHHTRPVIAAFSHLLPSESTANPTPGRRIDPAGRLKGWRLLGSKMDELRAEVRSTEGEDPILAGLRWDVPGLLSFYTDGHPHAYTLGRILGIDRYSQYDLWGPNPADDAQAFRGKTFLVVWYGDPRSALVAAFEAVSPPYEVVYREGGVAVAKWYVFVCRGFRGIDPTHRLGTDAGH